MDEDQARAAGAEAARLAQVRAALQQARAALEAALAAVAVAEAVLDGQRVEKTSAVQCGPARARLHRRWRLP